MTRLRQLTPQDVMFVGGERSNVYQHTAGVSLLDAGQDAGFGYAAMRRQLEQRLDALPQFRWKLHEVPLGLDLPYWVEDEHFSYDHHIHRIALPAPGDHAALAELVAWLYTRHLDRSRPLWEIWFVEGMAGGRFAIVQKLHHCMMDGTGAAKLVDYLWDHEPGAAPPAPDPALSAAKPGDVPPLWRKSLNAARHLYAMPFRIGRTIYEEIRRGTAQRTDADGQAPPPAAAPRTVFNADITAERGFVFGTLPLADIKTVRKHFEVTVNDVALAVVGSSLRAYLQHRGALPPESLRTSIAVSLRTSDDDDFSNRVTTATVTLATDREDPADRLHAIAAEANRAKAAAHDGGKGFLEYVQLLPPGLIGVLMGITPSEQVPRLAGVNVIVSNVRGSLTPMYLAGARVSAVYPMSILSPGGGINITCIGYADGLHFGVTIEPNLVPEPWRIIEGLHAALGEYLALAGAQAHPTRKRRVSAPRGAAADPCPPAKSAARPARRPRAAPQRTGRRKGRA